MKHANLKVIRISVEEMLNRPEQDYNPAEWKRSVTRQTNYEDCKFYVIEKDGVWSYARFYVSYKIEGLYLFRQFSAYSSSLTSTGFVKVYINPEGEVFTELFMDQTGKEGRAENNTQNRMLFAQKLTPKGIMVSNCI